MFNRAGQYAITFNSIGTISIPSNCNVDSFARYSSNFTGNIILEGNVSNYDSMLQLTAIKPGSRVNLIYNSTNELLVDELVALYGPSGTGSMGNIYKMSSASDIYKVAVTVLNGTISGYTIKAVNSGDLATFTVIPSSGYASPTVVCTNGQSGSISGNTLTVSNITSDTTCTVTYSK